MRQANFHQLTDDEKAEITHGNTWLQTSMANPQSQSRRRQNRGSQRNCMSSDEGQMLDEGAVSLNQMTAHSTRNDLRFLGQPNDNRQNSNRIQNFGFYRKNPPPTFRTDEERNGREQRRGMMNSGPESEERLKIILIEDLLAEHSIETFNRRHGITEEDLENGDAEEKVEREIEFQTRTKEGKPEYSDQGQMSKNESRTKGQNKRDANHRKVESREVKKPEKGRQHESSIKETLDAEDELQSEAKLKVETPTMQEIENPNTKQEDGETPDQPLKTERPGDESKSLQSKKGKNKKQKKRQRARNQRELLIKETSKVEDLVDELQPEAEVKLEDGDKLESIDSPTVEPEDPTTNQEEDKSTNPKKKRKSRGKTKKPIDVELEEAKSSTGAVPKQKKSKSPKLTKPKNHSELIKVLTGKNLEKTIEEMVDSYKTDAKLTNVEIRKIAEIVQKIIERDPSLLPMTEQTEEELIEYALVLEWRIYEVIVRATSRGRTNDETRKKLADQLHQVMSLKLISPDVADESLQKQSEENLFKLFISLTDEEMKAPKKHKKVVNLLKTDKNYAELKNEIIKLNETASETFTDVEREKVAEIAHEFYWKHSKLLSKLRHAEEGDLIEELLGPKWETRIFDQSPAEIESNFELEELLPQRIANNTNDILMSVKRLKMKDPVSQRCLDELLKVNKGLFEVTEMVMEKIDAEEIQEEKSTSNEPGFVAGLDQILDNFQGEEMSSNEEDDSSDDEGSK